MFIKQKSLQGLHCVVSRVHQGHVQQLHYLVEKDYQQVLAQERKTCLTIVFLYNLSEGVEDMI